MSDSIHIVCPHCQSINRVPANKLAEKPTAGGASTRCSPESPLI